MDKIDQDAINHIESDLDSEVKSTSRDIMDRIGRLRQKLTAVRNWTTELEHVVGQSADLLKAKKRKKKKGNGLSDEFLKIVSNSPKPVPADHLVEMVSPRAGKESVAEDEETIRKSLGQYCTRFYKAYIKEKKPLGQFKSPGIIAVEMVGDKYQIVKYKNRGNLTFYPANLIWHIYKFLEHENGQK